MNRNHKNALHYLGIGLFSIILTIGPIPKVEAMNFSLRCKTLMRKIGFGIAGMAVVPESMLLHWGAVRSTARSPITYLNGLQLWRYDFSGKRVLDIAAGKSRFAQFINIFYGATGAEGHAIDLIRNPRGKYAVNGDASHLPYENNSFDLIVSNMGIVMFDRNAFYASIDEALRVLKPGSELRLTTPLLLGLPKSIREMIERHPEVESIETKHIPFLSFQAPVIIRKKAIGQLPSAAELRKYYETEEKASNSGWSAWRPEILKETRPSEYGAPMTQYLLRKVRRQLSLEPEEIEFLNRSIRFTPELRRAVLAIYLECSLGSSYHKSFLQAWEQVPISAKSALLRGLLEHSFTYDQLASGLSKLRLLKGPFEADVNEKLKSVFERVDYIQRIDLGAKMRRGPR